MYATNKTSFEINVQKKYSDLLNKDAFEIHAQMKHLIT